MLKVGSDLDFAEETLDTERSRQLRLEHLHGDGAMMPQIAGEVHNRHSARSDLALDAVAFGDCSLQCVVPLHTTPL